MLYLTHQLCMWILNAPFSHEIGKDFLHIGHKVTGRNFSYYSPLQKKKKRRRNRKPKFKHIWLSAKYPTFIKKNLLVAQLISTLVLNFRDDDGWSWWMPPHPPHEAFFCFFFITDKKDLKSPFVPCRILKNTERFSKCYCRAP